MATSKIRCDASATKNVGTDLIISASEINTVDLDVSSNPSEYGLVKGFAIGNTERVAMVSCYFTAQNTIRVRCLNYASSTQSAYITVFYI